MQTIPQQRQLNPLEELAEEMEEAATLAEEMEEAATTTTPSSCCKEITAAIYAVVENIDHQLKLGMFPYSEDRSSILYWRAKLLHAANWHDEIEIKPEHVHAVGGSTA